MLNWRIRVVGDKAFHRNVNANYYQAVFATYILGTLADRETIVKELLATNNPVTLSYVGSLLDEAGIVYLVLDQNMSILEGSIGIIPRRVMVEESMHDEARKLIEEADLGRELTTHK